MIHLRHLPAEEARALGYRPLTEPFQLPAEQWVFDATLRQLDTGPHVIMVAVVKYGASSTIWRKGMKRQDYRTRKLGKSIEL